MIRPVIIGGPCDGVEMHPVDPDCIALAMPYRVARKDGTASPEQLAIYQRDDDGPIFRFTGIAAPALDMEAILDLDREEPGGPGTW